MAAILLDVDGVLHVSGDADLGRASPRCARLREHGHRLRFVTNSTTMSRTQLAEQLRADRHRARRRRAADTGGVAARTLAGKRVLALTMPGLLDDLDGLQLIGMNVEAVLIGGADER